MSSSVCIFRGDLHPVHRTWVESVGCSNFVSLKDGGIRDIVSSEARSIRDYDTVFCEDAFGMRAAAIHRVLGATFQTIRIVGGCGFYKMATGKDSLKGEAWAAKQMDGAIANSEWIRNYAEQYLDCPIKVVNPFITPWKYNMLQDVEYNPDSNNGLFFSRRYETGGRKGVSTLLNAVEDLKGRTTVHLLGEKTDNKPLESETIRQHGFVEKSTFKSYFEQVGYSVHPSTLDSFNLSVIESMLAGVPPIVTENTGAKEVVAQLDEKLIREPNSAGIRSGIKYFLGLNRDERRELSEQSRNLARPYTQENKVEEFKTAFEELQEEL